MCVIMICNEIVNILLVLCAINTSCHFFIENVYILCRNETKTKNLEKDLQSVFMA